LCDFTGAFENGSHWASTCTSTRTSGTPASSPAAPSEVVTWLRALAYNIVAARRAAKGSARPPWARVLLLVRDLLVAPHREALVAFEV